MSRHVSIRKLADRLIREESGATAVEYGIMVALIAAVIVVIVFSVGGTLNSVFTVVDTELGALAP
jgi:pilus assembly protein Flp/PilA